MDLMFKYTAYLNSLIFLLLGAFVCFNGPAKKQNIFYFAMTLSTSIYAVFFALSIYAPNPIISLWEVRAFHIFCLFLATFLFLFANEIIFADTFEKIWHYLPLLTSVIVSYFIIFGDVVKGVEKVGSLPNWTVPGTQFYLYALHFGAFTTLSVILLIAYSFWEEGAKKDQIKLTAFAYLVGLTGGWTTFLPGLGIKIPPYGIHFIFVSQLFIAYAILKYQLMNIKATLSKIGAFAATAGLYSAAYLFLFYFYVTVLQGQPRSYQFIAISLIWGLLTGASFNDSRLRLQTEAERIFIKGWYDLDKILTDISEKLISVYAIEDMLQVIKAKLKEIEIEDIELFLAEKTIGKDGMSVPSKYSLFSDKDENREEISCTHPFIQYLLTNKEPVKYAELSAELKSSINDFAHLKAYIYFPFHSSDTLEAIMAIGKKASEDPYDDKDFSLFKTILNQTQLVLDRLRPYEKIKKDFEANEKKLYDTERTLARSEKIASLANLIREYNHEIKTPLSIIRGETALLPKQPRDQSYLDNFRDLVFEQVDRANDIVESTLRLSLPKERKEVELNINEIIEGALRLFPLSGVHLEKMLASVPNIKGDRADLELVFVNLFKNAVEAMPDGGQITVKSYQQQEGEESFVYIEVSDTGAGIPAENLERIFEPFFSTHVTKGRGLGLSIVFRIVREHLGHVDVKSQLGKGTTFILKFPVK